MFIRNCPKCNCNITYTNRGNYRRAIRKNSLCNKCVIRTGKDISEKIRSKLLGRKQPNRKSNCKTGKLLPYKRDCPICRLELSYSSTWAITRANKNNSVCNSCSAKIYKKSWQYVIKDDHVKKMAATKAGYESYDLYMKDLDNRKKYYREVRQITRKQNLMVLENYDKLRGICGADGAYQVDHIIPISMGYEQNISPYIIGDIKNLQIIPWKVNLLKSNQNPS